MAIVVAGAASPGGGQTAFSAGGSNIAYDSFMLRTDAVVTTDSEDSGQGIENGTSWPIYGGGWQTSATGEHLINVGFPQTEVGQCYALHKHNLADLGITVELQTSDDAETWATVSGSATAPINNKTIFFVMEAQESHKFWRLRLIGHTSGTLRIAQIFIGPTFETFTGPNIGWTPPNLALNDKLLNSESDGGDFLGRSLIRRGSMTGFTIQTIPDSWVRQFWEPFMFAAEEHPFYYSWDAVNFPSEVAYCYLQGRIDHPSYSSHRHMTIALKFIALQI